MTLKPFTIVYRDLVTTPRTSLGDLDSLGAIEIDHIIDSYHEIVDVGMGFPPVRNMSIVRGGKLFSPHYSSAFYYFRRVFADGLELHRLSLYPSHMYGLLSRRMSEARRRYRYYSEVVEPKINEWLGHVGMYLKNMVRPMIRFSGSVMLAYLSLDDLVDMIGTYMSRDLGAFRATVRFGVVSDPVAKVMRLFGLRLSEISDNPLVVASNIWNKTSVNLQISFKNDVLNNNKQQTGEHDGD